MNVGILDTAPIVDAIHTAMPQLYEVGNAQSFGRLNRETVRFPSAFVVPLGEVPGSNRYQNRSMLSQRVVARFGVIWAVRDIADRVGTVAIGEIKAVRTEGILAICALEIPEADGPCEPVKGQLISGVDPDGRMFWQDDFTVSLNRHIPISHSGA